MKMVRNEKIPQGGPVQLSSTPPAAVQFSKNTSYCNRKDPVDGYVDKLRQRISELLMENLHLHWLLATNGITVPDKHQKFSPLRSMKTQKEKVNTTTDLAGEGSTPEYASSRYSESLTASLDTSRESITASSDKTDESKSITPETISISSARKKAQARGVPSPFCNLNNQPRTAFITNGTVAKPERVTYKSKSTGLSRKSTRCLLRTSPRKTRGLARTNQQTTHGLGFADRINRDRFMERWSKDKNVLKEEFTSQDFTKIGSVARFRPMVSKSESYGCLPVVKKNRKSRRLTCKPYTRKDFDKSQMLRQLLRVTLTSQPKDDCR